ncbi:hypothetical protein [Actinokineospora bangkokensis]|uniref:Integral membrane protein n=1 Tax=Actinokineospora bangkokensis TaxID=1193682 RepID=A0A1Q9LD36_9PSEU|nr:hypothetical protein [Actinokineospora bangkokensis]OLR89947.1 hypothetical protein BJP25_02875 [Actinokineospora bangkokensis]
MATRTPTRTSGLRADLIAAGAALALVAAAIAVGFGAGVRLFGSTHFPGAPDSFGEWPVLAQWLPHVGPGTPLAVVVAVAGITWGPTLAQRLSWRRALAATYGLGIAWTFSLALVDGWTRGIANQLTSQDEYLAAVPGITDIPRMLETFAGRILDYQPDSWITHVAGHPPGITLLFVWLDRIGLGGGAWAAVVCVLVGGLVTVAVPTTIAALGDPDRARLALPFLALFPGAVWMGVSADALFAGVTACGVALLAVGAVRQRWALCFAGGVLLGCGIFLSYGLMLMGVIALSAVLVAGSWKALAWAVPGALVVVAAFLVAGFWWVDGYHLVVERYYQGIANFRPYGYWVWADLASLVFVLGPATAAGLRRSAVDGFLRLRPSATVAMTRGALLAVLAADLSGLSKSEVERIWLPFAVWLVAACALLPRRTHRWWLAGQAVLALAVNHLLLTNW